jgi:D-alanine-D-alanine ligase
MKRSQNNKLNVCVVCGGVSPEHTISVASASSVFNNLDREKYNVLSIGINKDTGEWMYYDDKVFYTEKGSIDSFKLKERDWSPCYVRPGKKPCLYFCDKDGDKEINVDVFFPVIHGDNCEDGKFQGLIESLNYPLVGCGTLASAVGMDKDLTKIIAEKMGIQVVPWVYINNKKEINIKDIAKNIGFPCFVKPTASGSSCGIRKVKKQEELIDSIYHAFDFSDSVIIEKAINAREIEVAVLGKWNGEVKVSVAGEIIPKNEFYDYEAKYIDKDGAALAIPANIKQEILTTVQSYASKIFKALRCAGMSRVDFFIDKDTGDVFFNEVNTIPGFTVISMYPKLFAYVGVDYIKLLDELIKIGLEGNKNDRA